MQPWLFLMIFIPRHKKTSQSFGCCWARNIYGELFQYHNGWCSGPWCLHVINSHGNSARQSLNNRKLVFGKRTIPSLKCTARECGIPFQFSPLLWRHNGHGAVSNHLPHECLLNRLFNALIKENIEAPRHWPLCREFTGHRTNGQ